MWGTATMRTGGDDIAQAFALIGVRPKWASGSHRVSDFEILPMSVFDRPRVDVTLRVSGFFRDAFSNVIRLFDAAVQALAALDEAPDVNPIRARIEAQARALEARGLEPSQARRRAGYRVYGAKPGALRRRSAGPYRQPRLAGGRRSGPRLLRLGRLRLRPDRLRRRGPRGLCAAPG